MNQYLLIVKNKENGSVLNRISKRAATEIYFLESIDRTVLSNYDWEVYKVQETARKEQYIASGEIDHLIEEHE